MLLCEEKCVRLQVWGKIWSTVFSGTGTIFGLLKGETVLHVHNSE